MGWATMAPAHQEHAVNHSPEVDHFSKRHLIGGGYEPASAREFVSVALLSVSMAAGVVAAGCQLGLWMLM